jgi:hypothetical protein
VGSSFAETASALKELGGLIRAQTEALQRKRPAGDAPAVEGAEKS